MKEIIQIGDSMFTVKFYETTTGNRMYGISLRNCVSKAPPTKMPGSVQSIAVLHRAAFKEWNFSSKQHYQAYRRGYLGTTPRQQPRALFL